jgi:hypothetical protein
VSTLLHNGTFVTATISTKAQLYLGTRYIGLLAFVCLFIDMDGPRVACEVNAR